MSVPDHENHASGDQTDVLCDFCNESKALLYCRADSAKLCLTCDREVHSTNQLFKKHNRSLLCNSCSSSPSSIFCCTDSAVLCQNCDWETHKNFRSIHDRRPLEEFNGCPTVSELLNFLGLEDLGKKSLDFVGGNDVGLLDMLVWETPSVVSLDDLIAPNDCVDSGHSFQAMGVPPLPKNRNAACGKQKEEILFQLRDMAKTEPNFNGSLEDLKPNVEFQSQAPGKCQLKDSSPGFENNSEPLSVPSYEVCGNNIVDLMNLLNQYEMVSGQLISREKSSIVLSKNFPLIIQQYLGAWDRSKLESILPLALVESIMKVPIAGNGMDTLCWKLSTSGEFSISSAWGAISGSSGEQPLSFGNLWFKAAWRPQVRPTVSVFMLRLLRG